jgi:hypothetical protein
MMFLLGGLYAVPKDNERFDAVYYRREIRIYSNVILIDLASRDYNPEWDVEPGLVLFQVLLKIEANNFQRIF